MPNFLDRLKQKSRMTFEDFAHYKCGDKVYASSILCHFIRRGTFSSQKGRIMVIGIESEYTAWVEPFQCRRYSWWKPPFAKLLDTVYRLCGGAK